MAENVATHVALKIALRNRARFLDCFSIKDEVERDANLEYVKNEITTALKLSSTVFYMLMTEAEVDDEGLNRGSLMEMIKEMEENIEAFDDMKFEEIRTFYQLATMESAISFSDLIFQAINV